MATPKEKLEQLRSLVIMELKEIDQAEAPNVFVMYNEPFTREKTIDYVIDKIIAEKRTIASAIVAIEREYNINLQND